MVFLEERTPLDLCTNPKRVVVEFPYLLLHSFLPSQFV